MLRCQTNKIWSVHFATPNVVSEDDPLMCLKSALVTKTSISAIVSYGCLALKEKALPVLPREDSTAGYPSKRGSIFCRGCEKRHPSHYFYFTFGFRKDNHQRKKHRKYNNKAPPSRAQAFWSC